MNKFKVGDWVTKRTWGKSSYKVVGFSDSDSRVWVGAGKEGFICDYANDSDLLHGTAPEQTIEEKRKELSDATDLVVNSGVRIVMGGDGEWSFRTGKFGSEKLTKEEALDNILPLTTPAQDKLAKLEVMQRELADKIAEVRKEL